MIKVSGGFANEVRVVKTDHAKGEVTFDSTFHNLVLDVGLRGLFEYMTSSYSSKVVALNKFNYLTLGTGSATPTTAGTGLTNPAAGTKKRSNTYPQSGSWGSHYFTGHTSGLYTYHIDTENHIYWTQMNLIFDYGEGEITGNFRELGLGDSGDNMFSHALLRDEAGNPTTLTVTNTESVRIYYSVRYQDGMGEPQTGVATVGDQTVNFTLRQHLGNADKGWMATDTSTDRAGMWGQGFPFMCIRNIGSIPISTRSSSLDHLNDTLALRIVSAASESGGSCSLIQFAGTAYAHPDSLYEIALDPPLEKYPGHELILEVTIQFAYVGPPIENFKVLDTTSENIEFGWDPYPDATEYRLVLRAYGDIMDTATVPASTTSYNFIGLVPGKKYDLDIQAFTDARPSSRSIVSAITNAL